jgi:hypothetical protein
VSTPAAVTGSPSDPEFRRRRAAQGAAARHSLDAYINSIVRRAPELTPAQLDKLRGLLPPAGEPQPDEGA